MFDYTPEGLRQTQSDIALAYLNLMDTKLKKINRKLFILSLLGVAAFVIKHKDDIKNLINMKGE